MIIGIGTDVVQIPRIEKILERYGNRFHSKILNATELKKMHSINSSNHAKFLAKRFAAKEAISKAIGSGIGKLIGFKDITIMNDKLGKPFVKIENTANLQNIVSDKICDNKHILDSGKASYKKGQEKAMNTWPEILNKVDKFKSLDYSEYKIDISISDDYPIAIAFIVISR